MFEVHENCNETSEEMIGEKKFKKCIDGDFPCLNFGIGDRYCHCDRTRSFHHSEFANFWYTNVSCSRRREMIADDILKVNRNAVFLTKKNLVMNQFLEHSNTTPPTTLIKNVTLIDVNKKVSWFHPSFSQSSFDLCHQLDFTKSPPMTKTTAQSDGNNSNSSFYASSSLFLDKRIISLLRGITLYWFICLNTVLAKSELLKKKNPIALVGGINCDTATALLDAVSAANSTPSTSFSSALAELQVSLSLLEDAYELENDILWNLFRDSFIKESRFHNQAFILLPFDHCSKNNLLKQFVSSLVNTWIATLITLNEMPAPKRCYLRNIFRHERGSEQIEIDCGRNDDTRVDKSAKDDRVENNVIDNTNHHASNKRVILDHPLSSAFHLPMEAAQRSNSVTAFERHSLTNEVHRILGKEDVAKPFVSKRHSWYDAAAAAGHNAKQNQRSSPFGNNSRLVGHSAEASSSPIQIDTERQPPSYADVFTRTLCSHDTAQGVVPLDLRVRTRSASPGRNRSPVIPFPNSRVELSALGLQFERRSVSLDRGRSQNVFSASNIVGNQGEPSLRSNGEHTEMPLSVRDVGENCCNRFCSLMPKTVGYNITRDVYWNFIAQEFGDPETNAAFDNNVVDINAQSVSANVSIPVDRIKVERGELVADVENLDEPRVIDEVCVTTPSTNYNADIVVGDWPDNSSYEAPADGHEYDHCSTRNNDAKPSERPSRSDDSDAYSGSYSPASPTVAYEDAHQLAHSSSYGIRFVDPQYMDVDADLPVSIQPMHYDRRMSSIDSLDSHDLMNEHDDMPRVEEVPQECPFFANDPSTEFSNSYIHHADLPPSPPIHLPGADWSTRGTQFTSAGARTHVNSSQRHQFDKEVTLFDQQKGEFANATTAADDYEPLGVPAIRPKNESSTSHFTAQSQSLNIRSAFAMSTSLNTNSNANFRAHNDDASRTSTLVTWRKGSDVELPLQSSPAVAEDGAVDLLPVVQIGNSPIELPIESHRHNSQSAFLAGASRSSCGDDVATGKDEATEEAEAPNSESDDSELVALTHPSSDVLKPMNLTPSGDRYFLPPGILGGVQQECAEFNMWRWPWVNSVQLLRRGEPVQPQMYGSCSSNESDFPTYQMWKMPLINVVPSQHPRSAPAPQQPAVSAASSRLLPPLRKTNAASKPAANASSEYNLWSSPKLVNVEQLSGGECQWFVERCDATSNPRPNHSGDGGRSSASVAVQFPTFVPVNRSRVSFSDRGAFRYYRRQVPVDATDVEMRSPAAAGPRRCVREYASKSIGGQTDVEAAEKAASATDEDEPAPSSSSSSSLDASCLFQPIVPAFKVLKDAQPAITRSPSGVGYLLNNRRLFVFEHELDRHSDNPYRFQPKYLLSLNDKACQTEPELLYAVAAVNGVSAVARARPSPNSGAPRFWPPHHRPAAARQPLAGPQQLWPAAFQAAATVSASAPWQSLQLPSTTMQPTTPDAPFRSAAQPASHARAAGQPQYYSLEDVFTHLGQPGFANVGEYKLPLSMSYSSC